MSESRIQYSARNFDDFRTAILDISRKYYGDIFNDFNDASVGSWFVDIFADVADAINYHIDRVYQETSLDAAGERNSLLKIARNNGLKVPGRKAAVVEVELTCELPLYTQGSISTGDQAVADESYAPYIRRGTLFSTGMYTFELVNDMDFKEQFDENGNSNRQIIPNRDANGNITSYTYKKLGIAVAGQSKVYKKVITNDDIHPFMSVLLQDNNIIGVESILVKSGTNLSTDPLIYEYNIDEEQYKDKDGNLVNKYFEADSLIDQYRFGYEVEKADLNVGINKYNPQWENITTKYVLDKDGNESELEDDIVIKRVVKGKWKRFKNKFITEFTANGSLKVIFGAGIRNKYGTIPTDAKQFTQYMMSRMNANDYMGVLPEVGTTMYILYRVGGGEQTNIAKNTLTNIINLNMTIDGNCDDGNDATKKNNVRSSLTVTNTTPSYGGKDEPSDEELKYLIKYNGGAQNRCVTLHDYIARINEMPPKYGTPFRCGAIEENNKIVIYTLGLDSEGHLSSKLSEYVADNIKTYLSQYKMINDFIEIRSGKVVNVAFDIDVFIEKSYEKSEVVKRIIELVSDYMDISKHMMGDTYFIGDLEKEISKLDGVENLIELRCYNKVGETDGYSDSEITQDLIDINDCCYDEYSESDSNFDRRIDLKKSDKMLYSEANSMMEVKYVNKDIKVNVRER